MNAGFTVRCLEGAAEILLPPAGDPPGRPTLVTVARDGVLQAALVLIGRLDYREELADLLPNPAQGAAETDAALALAAYAHAGADGLQRLEGEFSLVVWDARRRRLIGMRDPFGAWPLFWCVRGSRLAMGTGLRPLADGQEPPAVDLDYVAEFLARPFVPTEVPCERTAYQGVRRVLPGTLVEVGPDGRAECRRYWTWPSRIQPVAETNLDDAADRFRELLDRAVRQRMRRGRTAAHLSGGMDSSSVAVLARRAAAERPGNDNIITISLVYDAADLAPERAAIDLVLGQGGPTEAHFIQADPAVGFDWFGQALPRHDEPYVGLWSLATNRLLVDAAERRGADVVLTGVGGDEILTYRPLHIADLLRRGRLFSGFRETAEWANATGQGFWSVLHKCGLEPLWPAGLIGAGPRSGRLTIPPWVTPEFARRHHLRDRYREFARRLFAPPSEFSESLARLEMTAGDWARWYLHAPLGIDVTHPFLDPRVVCYALGVPRGVRAAPGEPKPVLQAAMRGLLPNAIRNRKEKTGFNGPHSRGLARNAAHLERLVRDSRIHELGIFDADQLLTSMRRLAVGIGTKHNEWIDRSLALIAWFGQR